MIEAHAVDAWTSLADRARPMYRHAMVLAGFAAPMFLFLAGVSLALAIGARVARGNTEREAVAITWRRGWQIFGLAFLFRFQSWILSGGPASSLLKVDILNVMGLSIAATALLWGVGRGRRSRVAWLMGATVLVAMTTPIVRATASLSVLPDPIEWYLRPTSGRSAFALFPWAAFVLAGAAVGLILDSTPNSVLERRTNTWLGIGGAGIALVGYATSFLPPIYAATSFWTSSPTFFFLRLGIVIMLVPFAYVWDRRYWSDPVERWSPVVEFGRASLFVYWIHVEMAYGIMSLSLHRRFSLEAMSIAYVVFVALLYGLTRVKQEFSKPLIRSLLVGGRVS
jgi:uncharacterized membrane protein